MDTYKLSYKLDGNTITQVLKKNGTKNDVYYPSFIRMSEDTYLIAYYGYNSESNMMELLLVILGDNGYPILRLKVTEVLSN